MIITSVYEDGVLKPEEPLALAEHERVEVTVQPVPLYKLSPEERVLALEKFWRDREPVYPSAPRPTRDDLHDRD